MLRRSLLVAAMVLVSAGLAAAPAGIAAAAQASIGATSVPASHASTRCSGVIQITHLTFHSSRGHSRPDSHRERGRA